MHAKHVSPINRLFTLSALSSAAIDKGYTPHQWRKNLTWWCWVWFLWFRLRSFFFCFVLFVFILRVLCYCETPNGLPITWIASIYVMLSIVTVLLIHCNNTLWLSAARMLHAEIHMIMLVNNGGFYLPFYLGFFKQLFMKIPSVFDSIVSHKSLQVPLFSYHMWYKEWPALPPSPLI